MKNNLENAFRNSLQDYEAPYDSKAWEAVSSKLNVQPAAGNGLMSSALKWVLATVLFGTVVAGSYILWFDQEKLTASEVSDSATERKGINQTKIKEGTYNSDKQPEITEVVLPLAVDKSETTEKNIGDETAVENNQKVNTAQNNSDYVKEEKEDAPNNIVQTPKDPKGNEVVAAKFVSGSLSTALVCEGENVVISNQDQGKGIVRFKLNEQWIVLQPGKSFVIKPTSSINVNFVNADNEVIESAYIKVHNSPSANFTYEANIFEKGLPVAICEAYGDYASYNWIFDDKLVRSGAEVKHNFFDKGDYEVQLKVIDRNGCENAITKIIRIRDKYNLMAVDAFKPNGSDSRNRTFMPYSLTERDVKFQLTIVDPIDNNVVFTSNDVNNAWDGIDQKTGKITPNNKVYMWKVQIFNPLPNERPIYAGTIIHN